MECSSRSGSGSRPCWRTWRFTTASTRNPINGGRTLQLILDALRDSGYWCDRKVLNALDFRLPQKRERTIIVGFRTDIAHGFEWPQPQNEYLPLNRILERLPAKRHYISDRIRQCRHAMHKSEYHPGIWHENKAGNVNSHRFSCALRASASHNYLLVDGERRLTPREMLRLQGFPESFVVVGNDSQIRKQAGNAVPVPLVRAVIEQVIRAVDQPATRVSTPTTFSKTTVNCAESVNTFGTTGRTVSPDCAPS